MGFRGSRVRIPPSRLGPRQRRGPCRDGGFLRSPLASGSGPVGRIPLSRWVQARVSREFRCGALRIPASGVVPGSRGVDTGDPQTVHLCRDCGELHCRSVYAVDVYWSSPYVLVWRSGSPTCSPVRWTPRLPRRTTGRFRALPRRSPGCRRGHSWERWAAEAPLGGDRARQTWRCPCHLLLVRRGVADLPAVGVRQERAG